MYNNLRGVYHTLSGAMADTSDESTATFGASSGEGAHRAAPAPTQSQIAHHGDTGSEVEPDEGSSRGTTVIEVRHGVAPSRSASVSETAAASGGASASGSAPPSQPYGRALRNTLSRGSLSQPPAARSTSSPSASSTAGAGAIVASASQGVPSSVPSIPQGAIGADQLLAGLVASASETTSVTRSLTDNPTPVTVAGGVGISPLGNTNIPATSSQEATYVAPPNLTGASALSAVGVGASAPEATVPAPRRRTGSQRSLNDPRPTSAPMITGRASASETAVPMDVQGESGAGKRVADAPPEIDRGRSPRTRRDTGARSSGAAAAPASVDNSAALVEVERIRAQSSLEQARLINLVADARALADASTVELGTARAQHQVLMTAAQEQIQSFGLEIVA